MKTLFSFTRKVKNEIALKKRKKEKKPACYHLITSVLPLPWHNNIQQDSVMNKNSFSMAAVLISNTILFPNVAWSISYVRKK